MEAKDSALGKSLLEGEGNQPELKGTDADDLEAQRDPITEQLENDQDRAPNISDNIPEKDSGEVDGEDLAAMFGEAGGAGEGQIGTADKHSDQARLEQQLRAKSEARIRAATKVNPPLNADADTKDDLDPENPGFGGGYGPLAQGEDSKEPPVLTVIPSAQPAYSRYLEWGYNVFLVGTVIFNVSGEAQLGNLHNYLLQFTHWGLLGLVVTQGLATVPQLLKPEWDLNQKPGMEYLKSKMLAMGGTIATMYFSWLRDNKKDSENMYDDFSIYVTHSTLWALYLVKHIINREKTIAWLGIDYSVAPFKCNKPSLDLWMLAALSAIAVAYTVTTVGYQCATGDESLYDGAIAWNTHPGDTSAFFIVSLLVMLGINAVMPTITKAPEGLRSCYDRLLGRTENNEVEPVMQHVGDEETRATSSCSNWCDRLFRLAVRSEGNENLIDGGGEETRQNRSSSIEHDSGDNPGAFNL